MASSGSSPWANPSGWDTIWIGGVYYGPGFGPGGRVRVKGAHRSYRLDKKQPKGQDGWVVTYRGKEGRPFDITFWMLNDEQYDYFTQNVLQALFYGAGLDIDSPNVLSSLSGTQANSLNPNGIQALGVYHPSLAAIQINSIEVEDIGAIEPSSHEPTGTPEWYTCTVRVSEYLPPPPQNTTATPTGNKSVDQPTTPGQVPSTAAQQRAAAIYQQQARGYLLDTGHGVPTTE